jgi:hypothetical protein
MSFIPCFLCGQKLEKRISKNRKPYFICDSCGAQIFIRRKQGIEKLEELMSLLREQDFVLYAHTSILFEIQGVITEIRGVREEITKIENKWDFFATSEEIKLKTQTLEILNSRIENLLSQLAQIAEKGNPEK